MNGFWTEAALIAVVSFGTCVWIIIGVTEIIHRYRNRK